MTALNLSDFTFIPDYAPDDGAGGVVVPFDEVPFGPFGTPPSHISVIDRTGRSVVYDGGNPTYFTDTPAGTEDFAGWSYFEEEASEDLDGPCVQLFVLHPDFSEEAYLAVYGVA